ncbi:hypothetical protein Tco_1184268, partial [Tanacetum coccineum]
DDVILDGEDEGVGEDAGVGEVSIVGNNPISTPVYPLIRVVAMLLLKFAPKHPSLGLKDNEVEIITKRRKPPLSEKTPTEN